MPPLPVVEDAWECVLHQDGPSSMHYVNVFGIKAGGTPLTQAATDAIADFLAGLLSDFADVIEDDFSWTGIEVTDLRTLDGPQYSSDSSFPVQGNIDGQPLPPAVAGLISWGTARRGRSFRGRTYVAGFAETGSTGTHMETTAHTALAALADGLMNPDFNLGIISRYSGYTVDPDTGRKIPTPRDPGIITDVTSRVVHDLWATQRRRQPR